MITLTRKSPISGKDHSMELNVTIDQLNRFNRGEGYVQTIFPHLTDDEREFILTGITPDEWNETFKEEED